MSIRLKPVTFALPFRCLSDSLSTSMPLDCTGTQEEFIVIHLFYQMALFFQHQWDSKAWKKIHQPLQNFILYSARAKHKVHVSTISLFSSSSWRVMLAAVLRHSRHCHTATALPLPCNTDSGPLQEHWVFQSRGRNQGEHEGGCEGGQHQIKPANSWPCLQKWFMIRREALHNRCTHWYNTNTNDHRDCRGLKTPSFTNSRLKTDKIATELAADK